MLSHIHTEKVSCDAVLLLLNVIAVKGYIWRSSSLSRWCEQVREYSKIFYLNSTSDFSWKSSLSKLRTRNTKKKFERAKSSNSTQWKFFCKASAIKIFIRLFVSDDSFATDSSRHSWKNHSCAMLRTSWTAAFVNESFVSDADNVIRLSYNLNFSLILS